MGLTVLNLRTMQFRNSNREDVVICIAIARGYAPQPYVLFKPSICFLRLQHAPIIVELLVVGEVISALQSKISIAHPSETFAIDYSEA